MVLSEEPEFIGRYMGDIRPDIMADLIQDKVFIPTRMFNYQAICQKLAPKLLTAQERLMLKKMRTATKSSATKLTQVRKISLLLPSQLGFEAVTSGIVRGKLCHQKVD